MTQGFPDGPTDPSVSAMREENTTIVTPGYGGPAVPPPPSGPPGPPVAEPVTEPAGRVYATAEPVAPEPVAPEPGTLEPGTLEPGTVEPGAGRGSTTIADDVVERIIEKIVRLAVTEVDGVSGLHTAPEGGVPAAGPVSVRVVGSEATIDLAIQVEFGHAVHELVEQVRAAVVEQAQRLLGLTLVEVNVLVADVAFDDAPPDDAPPDDTPPGTSLEG